MGKPKTVAVFPKGTNYNLATKLPTPVIPPVGLGAGSVPRVPNDGALPTGGISSTPTYGEPMAQKPTFPNDGKLV